MNTLKTILDDFSEISPEDMKIDATLENMGLDSISIIEYQIEIERKLNIKQGSLSLNNNDNLMSIMKKIKGINNE